MHPFSIVIQGSLYTLPPAQFSSLCHCLVDDLLGLLMANGLYDWYDGREWLH